MNYFLNCSRLGDACNLTLPLPSSSRRDESTRGSSNKILSIYYLNTGGINTKAKALFNPSSLCDLDVIIISETWLDSYCSSYEFFEY